MTRTLSDPDIQAAAHRRRRDLSTLSAQRLLSDAMFDPDSPQGRQMAEKLSQMPVSWKNTYLKAMRGRSMKMAIRAFCGECMGWQRSEIPECTGRACPLYPYRPWKDD